MCQNVNAWHSSKAAPLGVTVHLLRNDGSVKTGGVNQTCRGIFFDD